MFGSCADKDSDDAVVQLLQLYNSIGSGGGGGFSGGCGNNSNSNSSTNNNSNNGSLQLPCLHLFADKLFVILYRNRCMLLFLLITVPLTTAKRLISIMSMFGCCYQLRHTAFINETSLKRFFAPSPPKIIIFVLIYLLLQAVSSIGFILMIPFFPFLRPLAHF